MDLFEANLALLRSHDPALAGRVENIPLPENVTVISARSGDPVPQVQSVCLHSSYQPVQEAKKQVSDFQNKTGCPTVVHGFGFGYHVLELLHGHPGEIIVIEPLMTVFRAFLSTVDLHPFLPRVRFLIAEPPPKILARYDVKNWNVFTHRPSARISQSYFQMFEQCMVAEKYLQEHHLKVMVVNPIYGGSLPTAGFCAQALENLGHEVASVHCEDFADSFFAVRKVSKDKKNTGILSELFMNLMNQVILAKAAEFQPDFVLALAQAPLSKDTLAQLKTMNIPVAFWFVEDFRTLTYWKDIGAAYDYIFTIQQNEFFDELESKGIKNYYYLPQACCRTAHKPASLNPEEAGRYSADLSFMGAAYYNRVRSFPQMLEFDFKIWGTGWNLDTPVGQRVQNNNERVSTDDCVKIYNAAKINLNLHSSTFHEDVNPNGDFINPRTFEIAACSGFQLVDERAELHDFFRVGEEIVTFKTIDDLKEKIRYYLQNASERETIAAKARDRVLREHTFEHRLKEMLVHVYQDRIDELKQRVQARPGGAARLSGRAGVETELGRYLKQFEQEKDFSIKTMIGHIEKEEGALTQNELLLLMVDQVAKQKVE